MARSSFLDDLEAGNHKAESKTKTSSLKNFLGKFLPKEEQSKTPSLLVSSTEKQPDVSFPQRDTPEEQQRDTWIRTEGKRILWVETGGRETLNQDVEDIIARIHNSGLYPSVQALGAVIIHESSPASPGDTSSRELYRRHNHTTTGARGVCSLTWEQHTLLEVLGEEMPQNSNLDEWPTAYFFVAIVLRKWVQPSPPYSKEPSEPERTRAVNPKLLDYYRRRFGLPEYGDEEFSTKVEWTGEAWYAVPVRFPRMLRLCEAHGELIEYMQEDIYLGYSESYSYGAAGIMPTPWDKNRVLGVGDWDPFLGWWENMKNFK